MMLKSGSKRSLATLIAALALTSGASEAAGLSLQLQSGVMRQNSGGSQLQTVPPGSARFCLPDTVTRRVDLAYGNSTTHLSDSGKQTLRELAQDEWESWVMLHQGYDFSSLAVAANVRSRMGFDQNRSMWWMSVSARPCRK